MNEHESCGASLGLRGVAERIRHWWHHSDWTEDYLAAAIDLGDLERRMREIERVSGGPAFVTFNH